MCESAFSYPYSNILIISAAEVVTLHVLHNICKWRWASTVGIGTEKEALHLGAYTFIPIIWYKTAPKNEQSVKVYCVFRGAGWMEVSGWCSCKEGVSDVRWIKHWEPRDKTAPKNEQSVKVYGGSEVQDGRRWLGDVPARKGFLVSVG